MSRLLFTSCLLKVLVLGNKRDLPNALDEKQLIEKMYVCRGRGRGGCGALSGSVPSASLAPPRLAVAWERPRGVSRPFSSDPSAQR